MSQLQRLTETARSGEEFVPGCSGKDAHETKGDAHRAIRRMRKGGRRGRLSVYLCPSCNKWHVTSHWFNPGDEDGSRAE